MSRLTPWAEAVGGFVNSNIKTAIFWVVLICLIVLLWTIVHQGKHATEEQIAFTDFIDQVKDKKVRDVNIAGNEVHGMYVGNDKGLRTLIPTNYPAIYDLLQQIVNGRIVGGDERAQAFVVAHIHTVDFVAGDIHVPDLLVFDLIDEVGEGDLLLGGVFALVDDSPQKHY